MTLKVINIKNARLPNLDTLIMIENTAGKHSGLERRKLWLKLPKKVMWQTFLVALDYLEKVGRIKIEMGKIIWNGKSQEKLKETNIPSYVY